MQSAGLLKSTGRWCNPLNGPKKWSTHFSGRQTERHQLREQKQTDRPTYVRARARTHTTHTHTHTHTHTNTHTHTHTNTHTHTHTLMHTHTHAHAHAHTSFHLSDDEVEHCAPLDVLKVLIRPLPFNVSKIIVCKLQSFVSIMSYVVPWKFFFRKHLAYTSSDHYCAY